MSGTIHGGHRARMKKRYREQGLDGFEDHEALELLLYYALPRVDVNPLAHALLDKFGSFHAVLDASPEALTELEGMGENTALLLRLVKDLNRRYLLDLQKTEKHPSLASPEAAGRFFLPHFYGIREERVYVAFVDDALRLLRCRLLFEGSLNDVPVSVRKLAEAVIKENAAGFLLAHNHPGGRAIPSLEDRQATQRLRSALEAVQIRFVDHIIVAGGEYYSMAGHDCFER
ncbi:MAG: DNA repair protein RadC [Oscillospiraceae bacterium]|nr:DNA repair protein RadC [Oscillospiraceae bacterium]